MNKNWHAGPYTALLILVAACTGLGVVVYISVARRSSPRLVPPATAQVPAIAVQPQPRPAAPEYEYIPHDVLIQDLVKRRVDLTLGDGSTTVESLTLEVCFTSGYTGVGHTDDGTLSNRMRAKCDAILKRLYRIEAADAARNKKLDEAYDRNHPTNVKQ